MTKRKSEVDENGKTVRKKRQAFCVSKDRAMNAKSEHNETKSLFSRLPRETRRQIWTYVLGDRVIHLAQERDYGYFYGESTESEHDLRNCVATDCCSDRTLSQLYELSKMPEETPIPVLPHSRYVDSGYLDTCSKSEKLKQLRMLRYNDFSHKECVAPSDNDAYLHVSRSPGYKPPPSWGRNLALLRTCKMVYHEANHILWTTNTFSFDDRSSFSAFMYKRTSLQMQLLTNLHLILDPIRSLDSMDDWKKAFTLATVRKLKGLKALHMYFNDDLHLHQNAAPSSKNTQYPAIEFLRHLQILPLKDVTFIIQSGIFDDDDDDDDDEPRLSHSRTLEWAEELRSKLLDPDAAANWQVDRDSELAMRAQLAENRKQKDSDKSKYYMCSHFDTAEECARHRQQRQDVRDAKSGRKRRKAFVATSCGCGHRGDEKREREEREREERENVRAASV